MHISVCLYDTMTHMEVPYADLIRSPNCWLWVLMCRIRNGRETDFYPKSKITSKVIHEFFLMLTNYLPQLLRYSPIKLRKI